MKTKPYYRTTQCQKCRTRRSCAEAADTPWRYDYVGNVYENGEFRFNDKIIYRYALIKTTIYSIVFVFATLFFLFGQLFVSFGAEIVDPDSVDAQVSANETTIQDNEYHGIDSLYVQSLFPTEKNWVNDDGQCGEYAGAMMLSINDSLHDGLYDEPGNYDNTVLLDKMKSRVHTIGTGTTAVGLASELTQVSTDKTHVYIIPACLVPSFIDRGYSVALFLTPELAGNEYGSHCVCAYAYSQQNGSTYYRACDNWGCYDALVDNGCIILAVVAVQSFSLFLRDIFY